MAQDAEQLVAGAGRGLPRDVAEVEVDLLVVVVEVGAGGVGEARVGAQDEGDAAGAGAGAVRGGVEEVEDGLDEGGEVLGGFDVGEEEGGGVVGEVLEVQAEFGGWEVVGVVGVGVVGGASEGREMAGMVCWK